MSKGKAWINALRLRTLPLSISGIIFGTFIAYYEGFWDTKIFILALITTVLFQIISNLANDLGDSLKGTDNENRVGPTRAVQSGIISKNEMKVAVIFSSILALISAGFLIYFGTQNLSSSLLYLYVILALLCVLAAITYTVGKKAYGYSGFGDVFVFIFFGLVSVLGVYTFYSKSFDWFNLLPATTIGLLSVAVLNLNNMRDRINDAKSNKNTIVVKIGPNNAKKYHSLLIVIAIICLIIFVSKFKEESLYLCFLPCFLLMIHLKFVIQVKNEKQYDPELKKVALSTFAIAVCYLIGVILTK